MASGHAPPGSLFLLARSWCAQLRLGAERPCLVLLHVPPALLSCSWLDPLVFSVCLAGAMFAQPLATAGAHGEVCTAPLQPGWLLVSDGVVSRVCVCDGVFFWVGVWGCQFWGL